MTNAHCLIWLKERTPPQKSFHWKRQKGVLSETSRRNGKVLLNGYVSSNKSAEVKCGKMWQMTISGVPPGPPAKLAEEKASRKRMG